MTFLVPLLILSCTYVGTNKGIKDDSKKGYFVVAFLVGVLAIILSIL